MKTLLLFIGEVGSNIAVLKQDLQSYFGTRMVSDMLENYPAMELREFNAADESFVNSLVANTNITVFAIQNPKEDFKSKNILYLKNYDSEA
jgi:hypothetical protein